MLPLGMRNLNLSWEVVTVQDCGTTVGNRVTPGAPLITVFGLRHWLLKVSDYQVDLAFVSMMLPHGSKEQRVGAEQMGKSFIWRLSTNLWRTFGRRANEKAYILPASWLNIATSQCVHVNITHLQTFDLSNEYLNVSTFVLALTRLWLQPAHLEAILVPLCKILETTLGEWPNGKSGQDPTINWVTY